MTQANSSSAFLKLADLLRQRLAVIADHAWRDRNPLEHLAELQRVSEAIHEEHLCLQKELPARLRHYLQQASYQKALAYIEGAES